MILLNALVLLLGGLQAGNEVANPRSAPLANQPRLQPLPSSDWTLRLTTLDVHQVPQAILATDQQLLLATARGAVLSIDLAPSRSVGWSVQLSPRDIRPRTLFRVDSGSVVVAGQPNEQPVLLDLANGAVTGRWAAVHAPILGACGGRSSTAILATMAGDRALIEVDAAGREVSRFAIRWADAALVHPLQRQMTGASEPLSGTCVIVLAVADRVAGLRGTTQIWQRRFPRPLPTPTVTTERREQGRGNYIVTSSLDRSAGSGHLIAAAAGHAFIALGTSHGDGGSLLDVYEVQHGTYTASFRAPFRVVLATASRSHLLLVTYLDGHPTVLAYRLDRLTSR